jgi:hypothetical protein
MKRLENSLENNLSYFISYHFNSHDAVFLLHVWTSSYIGNDITMYSSFLPPNKLFYLHAYFFFNLLLACYCIQISKIFFWPIIFRCPINDVWLNTTASVLQRASVCFIQGIIIGLLSLSYIVDNIAKLVIEDFTHQ